MNTQQNIEERLWNYIDGVCEKNEKSSIDDLLQTNAEWQRKYRELLDIHTLLHSTDLEEPSMRFTRNVMEEIAKYQIAPATKSYINKNIIWGIAAFFITMIVGFMIYGFAQVDWSSAGQSTTFLPIDISKINIGKIFNNTYINVFMMINVVLGLMFLDKYLSKRKKGTQTT